MITNLYADYGDGEKTETHEIWIMYMGWYDEY